MFLFNNTVVSIDSLIMVYVTDQKTRHQTACCGEQGVNLKKINKKRGTHTPPGTVSQ